MISYIPMKYIKEPIKQKEDLIYRSMSTPKN